jgi:hypothetical protein
VAGTPFDVAVRALDPSGKPDVGFTGTVTFRSSDPQAVLPPDYTFTTGSGGDNGSHIFTGVTLETAGRQTITVNVAGTVTLAGSATAAVVVKPADHFELSVPASVTSATPFDVTVTAKDPSGNTATGYRGTVHFTTTDTASGVVLPVDYTFTTGSGGDNGSHTFTGARLITEGDQTIRATDALFNTLTGSMTVTVTP